MKAALFTGKHTIEMVEKTVPEIRDGEALIQMKACGICGSEIPFYNGIPDYLCKHPWTIGHEMAGVVSQIKGSVNGLSIGDRVAIEPLINCGKCYACRIGKYNCCANLKVIGASTPGGFAEYVVVPVNRCHKIPDNMSFAVAALAEPYSIGANVLKRGQITKDDLVVINGAGPIGLTIIDFAKNMHGAKVLVSDVYDDRLARAKEFGADVVVNATKENVYEKVMEFTNNEGGSLVIDATGVPAVIESTQHLVAGGGRIVVVGYSENNIKIDGILIIKKEITLLGSRNSANLYPYVIESITSGKLKIDKLITNRFPFGEVAVAFDYINTNFKSVGKVMVEF